MSLRLAARLDGVERTLIRRIFDAAPDDAINLGLGQPDLPGPSFVATDAIAAIRDGRTRYTTTAGDPELRSSIAARYPGFVDGAEGVVVTIGSQQALFAACMALLDPGDELLIPDPGYPAYPNLARLLGATPVSYPLRAENGFAIDPDDVATRLTPRTRAIVVCEPSNPTGAYSEPERLERLVARLARAGVAWIADEIYAAFDYDGAFRSLSSLEASRDGRGGVVVSSLSKDLSMTGWRLGWLAGSPEVTARVTAIHQSMVTCASSVSQAAAARAFAEVGERARAAHLERFRARREIVATGLGELPALRWRRPRGAFYYYVDASAYGEGTTLAREILERERVILIPGRAFGATTDGYLRLSFAVDDERLTEALGRIVAHLGRRRA